MSRTAAFATLLAAFVAPSLWSQDVLEGEKKKIKIVWAGLETENYQIAYEKVIPESTVARIGKELEDILEQYVKLFRVKPEEKFRVKFLDSLNTYEQEGGDPSHPGKYLGASKTLIMRQLPFYQLIPTTYHEAFHQYLHMYVGDGVPIPIWFNEGMAMYYEGMQRDKRAKNPQLDPRNIDFRKARMVKDAVFARAAIELQDLIDADHDTFHDKDKESLHYNQSFAVIYFLMKASRGKLPLLYAKTLRETKDVEEANAKIFGKERKNLEKVEVAWKNFLANLKIPEKA